MSRYNNLLNINLEFLIFLMLAWASFLGGADLVSCGMSGLVRFWNTARCSLVAEFVAHKSSGSIILTVDGGGRYLVTADVHGELKVWEVQVSLKNIL